MEVLMVRPYIGNRNEVVSDQHEMIVKINATEFAQMCGLPGGRESISKLFQGKETTFNVGEVYKEAREIVDALPAMMTAIRTINSGAGKLEKVLTAKKEDETDAKS
jgi:hypothetical protein